jgi:Ca-activated chloride channel family protein
MTFDKPLILAGFVLCILFVLWSIHRYRLYRRAFLFFTSSLPEQEFRLRFILSRIATGLFFVCIIVALAGPRYGSRLVPEIRYGLDMILAFDLSNSMDVEDIAGDSRLSAAIAIAKRLMVIDTSDWRVGVAIAKGRGILAIPLTSDTEAVITFLSGLSTGIITGQGTNLESLVDAAAAGFQDTVATRRIVVLFSDGESLTGSLVPACERAAVAGITLVTVGTGSDVGAPVPSAGSGTISARRSGVLQNAALTTGGVFIDGNNAGAGLLLETYLVKETPEAYTLRREDKAQWRFFAAGGLAFLVLARAMVKKGKKGKGKRGLVVSITVTLVCSCSNIAGKLAVIEGNFYNERQQYAQAISAYMRARKSPEAVPYAEFGLGTVYYNLDEAALAVDRFAAADQASAGDRTLQYRIHYNTGIVRYEEGNFAGAVSEFRQALELSEESIEAKRNLELSLQAFSRNAAHQPARTEEYIRAPATEHEARSILFDYLRERREREPEHWKSREWAEAELYSGPDY